MGERIVRNDEVAGSIPVISTTIKKNSFDTRKCIKAFSFSGMKMFIFLFLVWRNQKNVILENNLDVNQVVAKNATTGMMERHILFHSII